MPTQHMQSLAHLFTTFRATPTTIQSVIAEGKIEPAMSLNGAAYYDVAGVEKIRTLLEARQTASKQGGDGKTAAKHYLERTFRGPHKR